MPRLSNRLFVDLALKMITLGLVIGATFPPAIHLLGFAPEQAYSPSFWMAALTAGLMAGVVNFALTHRVVKPRLALLATRMKYVERAIQHATYTGDWSGCTPDNCHVPVDSEDAVGDAARAFNDLVEALFRSHKTATAVSDFATAVSSELELEALSEKALKLFIEHTGATAGAVLAGPSGELRMLAQQGLTNPERLSESPHVLHALASGQCEKIEIPEEVQIEALMVNFRPREMVVVPAIFNEVRHGVVVLASASRFSRNTEWLLHLFRQGFGLALNNALAHDQLQRTAALDPLTGVYNRRFGLARLNEEFERSRRSRSPLGVVMVDLDHFKSINDNYGHLVGDRVLSVVARTLSAGMRDGDVLARYGGEEFMLVLPDADRRDCEQLAERLRNRIASNEFREAGECFRVTASIGVSAYPDLAALSPTALVEEADRALYGAKSNGRDQVVVA